MNATQELIKAAQNILEQDSNPMESKHGVTTIYGYKLVRCPNILLERYVKLANENIKGNIHTDKNSMRALVAAELELEERKRLGIQVV